MKTATLQLTLGAVLLLAGAAAWSGDVTVPNTFTAGTPAVAAEVNANFAAVKSAVDDNNARITSNETNKQNRVTGTCGTGSSIRTINTDGSVVCEVDDNSGGTITGVTASGGLSGGGTSGAVTVKLATGSVAVSAASLQADYSSGCEFRRGPTYFYWESTSTISYCSGVTSVSLPQGATLTGLSCLMYNTDTSGGTSSVYLMAASATTGGSASIVYRTSQTVYSTAMQTVTDTTIDTPGLETVDNNQYAYSLLWSGSHNTTTVRLSATFNNCRITYTY